MLVQTSAARPAEKSSALFPSAIPKYTEETSLAVHEQPWPVATAKYDQIFRALMDDIAQGKHAVGCLLPSEPALCNAFGASRHTVRAALKQLRDLGLIEGKHGVGSFVRAARPVGRYTFSFDSPVDLLQYATNTRVEVRFQREIMLNAAQAETLDRSVGERWWQVQTVRRSPDDGVPIASSTILIPDAYRAVLRKIDRTVEPIFALIQKGFGQEIKEIWQDICATATDETEAGILGVVAGHPALSIERRYFGRTGELFEVSRSVHPAGAFRYSMRMRLGIAGRQRAFQTDLRSR